MWAVCCVMCGVELEWCCSLRLWCCDDLLMFDTNYQVQYQCITSTGEIGDRIEN
jgi:hypothetical protein